LDFGRTIAAAHPVRPMEQEEHDLETVRRRPAKSGRVDYGDPVVLHDSSKRRLVFIPFFIRHSDHSELAAKLVTYEKAPPPDDWVLIEQKSISIGEACSRKLLTALRSRLAVAESGESGEFLVIRVAEGTAQIGAHDPAKVAAALTKVLSQDEIVQHLKGTELSTELVSAFRGAIRLNEMRTAVAQLRQLLDSGEASEPVYQDWCEKHSWAFGNAYVVKDEVREISTGDALDLMLPSVIAGYRDIVELKRPDMAVLYYDEPHKNFYFSAEVSKAIGQCHRYLDVLHEAAAKGLRDHPEIVAYHPRAIVVIGRSSQWSEDRLRALHGLNRRLSGITVMTYDHLLAQGERLVEMLGPTPESLPELDAPTTEFNPFDDDVPF
jgi:antiviral defense system Shedu protein SduA